MAFAASTGTILITGASRGIGFEFVKQFAGLPSPPKVLIATCRNPDGAKELQGLASSHSFVHVVKLDVTVDKDIDKAVEETRALVGDLGLTLLINNAGTFEKKPDGGRIGLQTRDRMNRHFDVNVTSPIIVTQKFLPLLRKAVERTASTPRIFSASRAAIVMISSYLSSQNIALDDPDDSKDNLDYRCSKTALNMASVLLSRDMKPQGILVMALHPGWVKTAIGGFNAELTVEKSVTCCLKVIGQADESNHGRLTNYLGDIMPY